MHQQTVVRRCGQRLRQDDSPLQIVDVVIEHRHQVLNLQNDIGILVADLDAYTLGTPQNVLVAQEIERSVRAQELIALGHCSRIRGKAIQQQARLAETGYVKRLIMQIGAVQPTVDLC